MVLFTVLAAFRCATQKPADEACFVLTSRTLSNGVYGSVQLGFLGGDQTELWGAKMSFIRGILFVIASFILIGTASAGLEVPGPSKQSQQRVNTYAEGFRGWRAQRVGAGSRP